MSDGIQTSDGIKTGRIKTGRIGGPRRDDADLPENLRDVANRMGKAQNIRFQKRGDGNFTRYVDGSEAGTFTPEQLQERISQDPFYQNDLRAPQGSSDQETEVIADDEGGGSSTPAPKIAGIIVKDGVLYNASIHGTIGSEIT